MKSSSAFAEVSRGLVGFDVDLGVDGGQAVASGLQLRAADVWRAVQNLSLKVAFVDVVEIDDAERADAGRGEIERCRRSETSRADAEYSPALDAPLSVDADLGQDEVTAVALNLGVAQLGRALGGRRAGGSPGNRRHDADDITRLELGRVALEIADVIVVDVDVHEVPQLAVVGIEMPLEVGELRGQGGQHFADGAAFGVDGVLLAGVRA